MERNQVIGIVLIMATFMLWTITSAPSKEEMEKSKRTQDSIALAAQNIKNDTLQSAAFVDTMQLHAVNDNDSLKNQANQLKFGVFGAAASGQEQEIVLENEVIQVKFSSKGGIIKEVLLKKHVRTIVDSTGKETKELITMLNSPENKFYYALPVPGAINKVVNTSDLYFDQEKQANTITFRANVGNDAFFEQKYTLSPDNYTIDYSIQTQGLGNILASGTKSLPLVWEDHLKKYEKGVQFEQNYSTVYFK